MTALDVLLLCAIGALTGAAISLAWPALGGSRGCGAIVSALVGIVGAWAGRLAADHLPALYPVETGGRELPVAWGMIGAALAVTVANLLRPRFGPVGMAAMAFRHRKGLFGLAWVISRLRRGVL